MTPDNRALWELVEKWRNVDPYLRDKRAWGNYFANELAEILERPVVVGITDEVVQIAEHTRCAALGVRIPEWEIHAGRRYRAMRAALESMVRGKS